MSKNENKNRGGMNPDIKYLALKFKDIDIVWVNS